MLLDECRWRDGLSAKRGREASEEVLPERVALPLNMREGVIGQSYLRTENLFSDYNNVRCGFRGRPCFQPRQTQNSYTNAL